MCTLKRSSSLSSVAYCAARRILRPSSLLSCCSLSRIVFVVLLLIIASWNGVSFSSFFSNFNLIFFFRASAVIRTSTISSSALSTICRGQNFSFVCTDQCNGVKSFLLTLASAFSFILGVGSFSNIASIRTLLRHAAARCRGSKPYSASAFRRTDCPLLFSSFVSIMSCVSVFSNI